MLVSDAKNYVKNLHDQSSVPCMREWFYSGHVEVVVDYVEEISLKVGADVEIASLAAIFHDVARVNGVNDDPQLMEDSLDIMRGFLMKYNYPDDSTSHVEEIIRAHSCRGGAVPDSLEGKVMVTADALAHLMTDFYFILPFRGWWNAGKTFDDYKNWISEKVERDFSTKICFDEYKELARDKYEALKVIF